MGLARLDRLGKEFPVSIDLKAYFLHPEIPRQGQLRRSRPFEPQGQPPRWQTYAEEEGLVMKRAELTPYSRVAQAATEYAKRQGPQGPALAEAFHHAAYKALWADGANLGDMAVIEGLATAVGLDWADLGPKLESGEYDAALQEQHDEAMRVGVEGVPAFVVDERFWFTGAQPMEVFRLAARRALKAREGEDAAS